VDGGAARDRLGRHPEHHAGLLRFGNRHRPGVSQREHALGAIGPHPGQQQRHRGHAAQTRRRMEQDVDRGSLIVDGRPAPDDEA